MSEAGPLTTRVHAHLAALYPHADLPELTDRVLSAIGLDASADDQPHEPTSP